MPVPTETVAHFIAHMDEQGVSPSTIQSLVSGIGFFHKIRDLPNPATSYLVKRTILGAKSKAPPPVRAAPIQLDLLHDMCDLACEKLVPMFDAILVKAMLLFAYHGCLRFGEMGNSGGTKHTINIDQVRLGHDGTKGWVIFTMASFKNSKSPVNFRLNETEPSEYCPVRALTCYLTERGGSPGPLFARSNGKAVSREFFAKQLKFLVAQKGLDPSKFNTHSLRAGRATDLAIAGTPDAIIKETGRWSSNAFLDYVRFSSFVLPGC